MKKLLTLAAAALAVAQPGAAQNGPPPLTRSPAPAEPGAIPLYGKDTPGTASTEIWGRMGPRNFMVRNVTRPTLTPFLPKPGKANGAAVIVAPGGAFMGLAITHEGWDVARALADRGITAFVLKYRLIRTPADDAEAGKFMGQMMMKEVGGPMDGALRLLWSAPARPNGRSIPPASGSSAFRPVR
jgi:hypothetical protein